MIAAVRAIRKIFEINRSSQKNSRPACERPRGAGDRTRRKFKSLPSSSKSDTPGQAGRHRHVDGVANAHRKVELLPGGGPARRRVIGTLEIANVSDLVETSSYAVEAEEATNHLTGTPSGSKITAARSRSGR
jgi:hypothetical protein